MQKVVVVIPIHKPDPTKNELASLAQCYKILGSHPIRIVAPEGLDTNAYTKVVPDAEFVFIDKVWLSSIVQYNKLKISLYFYNLFKDYEYLLTYELDAWVFRDELLYWCDKGYDYIGAPWFEDWCDGSSKEFLSGGNSGFSLRKVSSIRKIIKRRIRLAKIREVLDTPANFKPIIKFRIYFYKVIMKVKDRNNVVYLLSQWERSTEDYLWSYLVPNAFTDFTIASPQVCLMFSFEVQPGYLFQLNNHQLPFGCHAWEKFDIGFWYNYILK